MTCDDCRRAWHAVVVLLLVLICSGTAHGKRLVFYTQDFKPFSYLENGKVAGPFRDIIDAVCKEAGFQAVYSLYPWRRAIIKAQEGEAQGLFVLGYNLPRSKWLYFSYPVVTTEYGFFFRHDDPLDFQSIEDLKNVHYEVAVYGPSNTSAKLKEITQQVKNLRVDMTPDDIECFWKLSLGRVQAVYSNKDVGKAIIQEYGIQGIRYGGLERELKYYIGFLKDNVAKETVEIFNAAYKKLYQRGTIKEILDGYHLKISLLTEDLPTTTQISAEPEDE